MNAGYQTAQNSWNRENKYLKHGYKYSEKYQGGCWKIRCKNQLEIMGCKNVIAEIINLERLGKRIETA